MTTVEVGNGEQLAIEERPHGLRLYPAAAGARIELEFTVKTMAANPLASAVPFHITADMFASRLPNHNERMVGQLTAKHLVTPTPNGAHLTLAGFISAEQLRAIEDVRGAHDLTIHLELALFTTGEHIERFRADEHIYVPGGVWNTQIERVDAAMFVEVLVPMPTVKTYTDAVALVREGRELLHEGDEAKHIDSALVRARMALEPVRKKLRTVSTAKNAPADPTQRSLAVHGAHRGVGHRTDRCGEVCWPQGRPFAQLQDRDGAGGTGRRGPGDGRGGGAGRPVEERDRMHERARRLMNDFWSKLLPDDGQDQ